MTGRSQRRLTFCEALGTRQRIWGRNCIVLTNWTAHLETLTSALRGLGHDP